MARLQQAFPNGLSAEAPIDDLTRFARRPLGREGAMVASGPPQPVEGGAQGFVAPDDFPKRVSSYSRPGTPWWQYALPIVAGVASAATPGISRGVGTALGAFGMFQRMRQQSAEEEDRERVSRGLDPIIDVLSAENTPPFMPTPEAADIMARGGVNPGARMSPEEAAGLRLQKRKDPYGAAERAQQIAGRRPIKFGPSVEKINEMELAPGSEISVENPIDLSAGTGGRYTRRAPKAETSDTPRQFSIIEWVARAQGLNVPGMEWVSPEEAAAAVKEFQGTGRRPGGRRSPGATNPRSTTPAPQTKKADPLGIR